MDDNTIKKSLSCNTLLKSIWYLLCTSYIFFWFLYCALKFLRFCLCLQISLPRNSHININTLSKFISSTVKYTELHCFNVSGVKDSRTSAETSFITYSLELLKKVNHSNDNFNDLFGEKYLEITVNFVSYSRAVGGSSAVAVDNVV